MGISFENQPLKQTAVKIISITFLYREEIIIDLWTELSIRRGQNRRKGIREKIEQKRKLTGDRRSK
jgi:hypothetical protein